MIAKVQSINYGQNALLYCEKGGEILFSNECFGNANDIFIQMQNKERLNDRCHKKTFHAKIRIAPQDKGKLNNQNWIDISKAYARKIGFQNNIYAVYIHEENTEKEHIHIVSTRITDENLAVRDNYTYYKNMDFCRDIERKYKLRQVERKLEKLKAQQEFISTDLRAIDLKTAVFSAVEISDNLTDLVFHLKNRNIKVNIGRGISFTDSNGIKKKGSQLDRKLSLSNILARFKGNDLVKKKSNQVEGELENLKLEQKFISKNLQTEDTKEAIFSAIEISDSLDDVVFHLKNQNIKTKIARGIAFIDANGISKKGSEIDRKLSLKGIEKLLTYKSQEKRMQFKKRGPSF